MTEKGNEDKGRRYITKSKNEDEESELNPHAKSFIVDKVQLNPNAKPFVRHQGFTSFDDKPQTSQLHYTQFLAPFYKVKVAPPALPTCFVKFNGVQQDFSVMSLSNHELASRKCDKGVQVPQSSFGIVQPFSRTIDGSINFSNPLVHWRLYSSGCWTTKKNFIQRNPLA